MAIHRQSRLDAGLHTQCLDVGLWSTVYISVPSVLYVSDRITCLRLRGIVQGRRTLNLSKPSLNPRIRGGRPLPQNRRGWNVCDTGKRQSRDHLFKGCRGGDSRKNVGEISLGEIREREQSRKAFSFDTGGKPKVRPSDTAIRDLLGGRRSWDA